MKKKKNCHQENAFNKNRKKKKVNNIVESPQKIVVVEKFWS